MQLRVDKLTIAALSSTLQDYLYVDTIPDKFPMVNRYTRSMDELLTIAVHIADRLKVIFEQTISIHVSETQAEIGSGSLPVETLPSIAVMLTPQTVSVDKLAKYFRLGSNPVIGRIEADQLWFDVRTLYGMEQELLIETASEVARKTLKTDEKNDEVYN